MKIEIEIPNGPFCTGCPCTFMFCGMKGEYTYGCTFLHAQCKAEGVFQNRAAKHPKCPGKVTH